jgi:hypothetical protein
MGDDPIGKTPTLSSKESAKIWTGEAREDHLVRQFREAP